MKIKRLDDATIKKIAAGEVITSPAAVVKELIENSIDAGGKKITVELKKGGKELIRVVDDGKGMSEEDILLSIERYTTSKINTIEDIERLKTYGFRGEALASIKEVSRMVIESSENPGATGTRVEIEEGKIKRKTKINRERGTTVSVYSLFYNLPVRRHNMKSEGYELKKSIEVVKNYAIVYPDINYKTVNEKGVILNLIATNDRINKLREVFDDGRGKFLKEIKIAGTPISVEAYIIDPAGIKKRPVLQKIFINGRPVFYRLVTRAVYDGYGIYSGEMNPDFVFFLEIEPSYIDVNIHPTKERVIFKDEKYLYDFIYSTVRRVIKKEVNPLKKNQIYVPSNSFNTGKIINGSSSSVSMVADVQRAQGRLFELLEEKKVDREVSPLTKLWQIHNLYIFAETEEGFIIIDQHAAHERIMYEKVLNKMEGAKKQGLLFPLSVTLKPEEIEVYLDLSEELNKMGFDTRLIGIDTVAIDAIPEGGYVTEEDVKEIITELQKMGRIRWKRETIAATVACKSAIKKGQALTYGEMERLIDELFACKEPYFCPHGRPTIIKHTLDELNRLFGRT